MDALGDEVEDGGVEGVLVVDAADVELRELVVLAEEAAAGAAGEEDGSGAVGAGDAGLLAPVGDDGADAEFGRLAAEAGLAGEAVGAAASRAERAVRVVVEGGEVSLSPGGGSVDGVKVSCAIL